MMRENVIDVMNKISENIMVSKLVYRSVTKKTKRNFIKKIVQS